MYYAESAPCVSFSNCYDDILSLFLMKVYLYAPERAFVEPYMRRAMPGCEFVSSPADADCCVMLSSVDVYSLQEGTLIAEDSPVDEQSDWHTLESRFRSECAAASKAPVVLRCADIIGTGMTGWPRELTGKIWKGYLMHFAGNDARVSVVHATDVAQAVAALVKGGAQEAVYNVTDGANPMFRELVDSLAFRMREKHVSTLSTKGQLWFGRILYGRRLYRRFTTQRTFDCSALCRDVDYRPTPVTEYLRTHVYDESSL